MLPEVTDFCRLLLLRHPELHASHRNIAVGAGAAPLSRRGKERVLAWLDLFEGVAIDGVACADQPQCSGPAAGLARGKHVAAEPEARLRDQNMGRWQGRRWDELVAEDKVQVTEFFERFADHVPPEGESLGQAVERMIAWWTDAAPRFPGRTVAVVAAGSLLSGFAAALLGMRLSRSLSLSLPHGGIGILDVFANGVRVSAWNADALANS